VRYRRGLSTVVGAVFFIIATTTVITYITYSMNSIDNFSQSVIVSESQNIDRGREEITISQVRIDGLKFNMTVVNTGSLPVHLTRLWVTNQDGVTADQKADLDINLNPGQQQYNIGQFTGISAVSTESYNLKVVTERGNISTFHVSPDVSTQIQLVLPGEVQPGENFRVVTLITNNSTMPNNIVDLVPIILNNCSLTQIDGPLPPSIKTLPQGNTATFTSTYVAPSLSGGIGFNATYVGAPTGAIVNSNMTVALSAESEAATNSQWSQAASRVGILISGIPNPVNSASGSAYLGKWGIGVINPLDREVQVYSVGILASNIKIFDTLLPAHQIEPTSGWRRVDLGNDQDMILWEGGSNPITIGKRDVGQFRVETNFKLTGTTESVIIISALTSEGKLNVMYTISVFTNNPIVNAYYTSNPSDPLNNWTYIISGIPSGKNDQIFNATIHNPVTGSPLASRVKLIILVPADFTNVFDITAGANGWDPADVFQNDDGSHVINVQTTLSDFVGSQVYQFSANVPTVTDDKLYVFQTTTVYPDFVEDAVIQLASALSEAGVEVVP